jgi:hypothetical protein
MITGMFRRGGMGNPIEGHGKAIVQLGETFGDGDITVASTADLTNPNLDILLQGDGGRNFLINGQLGNTVITGDIEIAGIGSAATFTDVPANGNTVGFSPGSSIGTFTVVQDMLIRGSDFTYNAEVDDAGGSDLIAVGGTLDVSTPTDTLDISFFSGTTLSSADYTLATYGSLVGLFDSVIFDGTPVANPLLPGAIGGTHRLAYTPAALLLTTAAPVPGDFDVDGDVDGDDLMVWEGAYGLNALADADGDGDTDGRDFLAWQRQFGSGVPLEAADSTVPEPRTILLALVALLGTTISRRLVTRGQASLDVDDHRSDLRRWRI